MSETTRGIQFVQKVRPVFTDITGTEIEHPAEGLPFRELFIIDTTGLPLADNATRTWTFTVAEWGAGLSYFLQRLQFWAQAAADFNDELNEGIRLRIYIGGDRVFLNEMVIERPIQDAVNFDLYVSFNLKGRVLDTETLTVTVENNSGITIQPSIYIGGIAI